MHCYPTDLIKLIILLNCTLLSQPHWSAGWQTSDTVTGFSSWGKQTFKSQITKMTKLILGYLVIRLDISDETFFGETALLQLWTLHCLPGCLSNCSTALLFSLNLIVHEVHVNATPTGSLQPTRACNTWFSKWAEACSPALPRVPNIRISMRLKLSYVDIWDAHRIKLHPRASKYPPLCPILQFIVVHTSGVVHLQKNRPGRETIHSPWRELQSLGQRIPRSQEPEVQSKVRRWATTGGGVQSGKRSLKCGP